MVDNASLALSGPFGGRKRRREGRERREGIKEDWREGKRGAGGSIWTLIDEHARRGQWCFHGKGGIHTGRRQGE